MVTSLWVPQTIYAAAELGVADVLGDAALRSEDVAKAIGADAGAVYRLLRALVALGLATQDGAGAFALTAVGACLRADSPTSLRSWALLMGGPRCWEGWGRLADCVRSGETAPRLLHGMGTFELMKANPREFALFDTAMVELTRRVSGALAAAYDFSGMRRVVDVGGGLGALLPEVLRANPTLHGVVFDQPHCREGARRHFDAAGLGDRYEFVGGDFFESVPPGADAYLVKSVIHDWDDARCLEILARCRAAMTPEARLLVLEVPFPERVSSEVQHGMNVFSDLNMLVMAGGRERTEAEYRDLLETGGFRVSRIVPTASAYCVIEARVA
jgi:hypothetical protein